MFENLTVKENIFIGRQFLQKDIFINWGNSETMNGWAIPSATDIAFSQVKNLSIADRHIVEIARALSQDSKIIIMDEPTAALGVQESRSFI